MKNYKIDRASIVELIVQAGIQLEILIDVDEIDSWVQEREIYLQNFFLFDQLTPEHLLIASEMIRAAMEDKYFNDPFYQVPSSQSIAH